MANFPSSSLLIIFISFLFIIGVNPQPLCYTSCLLQSCSATSSSCTACDTGSILLNSGCLSIGSQSEPIRLLAPLTQTTLDVRLLPEYSNRPQIQCWSSSFPSARITYLNVTTTRSLVYTLRLPQIQINTPHQYITIKLNAILLNPSNSQILTLLVIRQSVRLYNQKINVTDMSSICNISNSNVNVGNAFYINVPIALESAGNEDIFISLSTERPGDELGISNIQVYYGNCYEGCKTCSGSNQNQCRSCRNFLSFQTTTQTCSTCPTRFYQLRSTCYPCPYNCLTCTYNTTSGNPACTSCQTSIGSTTPNCTINNYINSTLNSLNFNNSTGWSSSQSSSLSDIITTCGSYSLIGGLPYGRGGSTLTKTFTNLPVHSSIWLKFSLFLIDQDTGSTFTAFVEANGVRVFNASIVIDSSTLNTNECGTSRQQFIASLIIPNIVHQQTSVKIDIVGQGNYFGIRDFTLGVVNRTNLGTCAEVNENNQCIRCNNGFALTSQNATTCTVCPTGTYLSNNFCLPCAVQCRTCNETSASQSVCTSCDAPLIFDEITGNCADNSNSLYTTVLTHLSNSTNINNKLWSFYPQLQDNGITQCGKYNVLGAKQLVYRQLKMGRNFGPLPTHQGVSLQFMFYQIDDYDLADGPHRVYFKINGRQVPYVPSNYGYDICGNSSYDSIRKIILNDTSHTNQTLTFQIHGNKTKFAISNMLLFLFNCQNCQQNAISYEIETIPMFSVDGQPKPTEKGMKSKIIFSDPIQISSKPQDIFQIMLVNKSNEVVSKVGSVWVGQSQFNTGQKDPFEVLQATLYQGKQLIMFQNLIKDEYNKKAVASVLAPDQASISSSGDQNIPKTLLLSPVQGQFSRYDDIYSILDTQGQGAPKYRANIRNLMNLFRGISILALFIGLISFLFGISDIFDDLFVMCQIIFVHIFINSAWISISMKVPVGAMNLVQFMAWLPIQGRNAIEKAIIPSNHYQRSPIVYEQYWKDISFARTIYHTVIFLIVMFALYWLINLIKSLRQPSISNVMQLTQSKKRIAEQYYYNYTRRWFVYLDRVIRFTFFTVIWAASLQFIYFKVQPGSFMGWNAALCIIMFIAYIVYIFLGYFYLRRNSGFMQANTYKQKFDGTRIRQQTQWYFIFRYLKWFVIAILVSQLYYANPLAVLIPLMIIHLFDAAIIFFLKPFIFDSGQSQRIVSRCSRIYWIYYRYSHVVQNILFFILEIVMIVMYATRSTADKDSYISTGYAACVFIIFLFINGLMRVVWGFIRIFEVCMEDVKSRAQEIKSEDDIGPLKYLDLYRANQNQTSNVFPTDRKPNRNPSIEIKMH